MKELSKKACELIDLLKKPGRCNQDTTIGIILMLGGASLPDILREKHDADAHYAQLIDWIKLNPKADQSAILDKQDKILDLVSSYDIRLLDKKKPAQKMVHRATRKVAVF